jgi:VCBS repeat-containing protein
MIVRRRRLVTVGAATLLVSASVFVSVSALVSGATAVPSEVRLHLAGNGRSFSYGTTVQNLTTAKSTCVINSAEPVMDLSSSGTQSAPGMVPDGIGVKGTPSSGNGTPCGQVDGSEVLRLSPGSALAGHTFTGVRFDLEMTGNAVVVLTLSKGATSKVYRLQTGTSITVPPADTSPPYFVTSGPTATDLVSSCAAAQSSGPNSSGSDNCQWRVTPGFNFDTIAIATSIGTVALEGSNDFGSDPAFDSLFYIANSPPVANDDTVATNENTAVSGNVLTNDTDADGNSLTATKLTDPAHGTVTLQSSGAFTYTPSTNYTGSDSFTYAASDGTDSSNATVNITVFPTMCSLDTVSDSDGTVSGSFTRLSDPLECKRYTIQASATDGTVLFTPTGSGTVAYRGSLSFGPEPAPVAGGSGVFPLLLRYDPAGGTNYKPVQWCIDPQFDSGGTVTSATLPAGETWCIASADTRGDVNGDLNTVWQVYGRDDPNFIRR